MRYGLSVIVLTVITFIANILDTRCNEKYLEQSKFITWTDKTNKEIPPEKVVNNSSSFYLFSRPYEKRLSNKQISKTEENEVSKQFTPSNNYQRNVRMFTDHYRHRFIYQPFTNKSKRTRSAKRFTDKSDQELELQNTSKELFKMLEDVKCVIDKFENQCAMFENQMGNGSDDNIDDTEIYPLKRMKKLQANEEPSIISTHEWTSWSEWGPCSVTCGQGTCSRSRSKTTDNKAASIKEVQEKVCILPACSPFDLTKLFSKIFNN